MATVSVRAHCHCKRFDFSFDLPANHLPLQSAFCSCSSCRHATGQLAASFATVSLPQQELKLDVSRLSRYDTSEIRQRYFCPRCGANVVDLTDDKWRFCTGTIAETPDVALERKLIFVEDTVDGGMAPWLKDVRKAFAEGSGSRELQDEALWTSSKKGSKGTETLLGKCHCGRVQFEILPPTDGQYYEAGLDACASCRLTTGFEISSWTSVPLTQVRLLGGAPLLRPEEPSGYESSPGVFRYFCGTCGAATFIVKKDQSWVDIAAGLLRADEGARAESWLQWKELGFMDEMGDQDLRKQLERRFEEWSRH